MGSNGHEGIKGVDLGCGLKGVGVRVSGRYEVLKPDRYIVAASSSFQYFRK